MKTFQGKVLCLDRSDINTDEIIPARYLTEIEKKAMGPHLLEDLKMEGFKHPGDLDGVAVILTRDNFGCGSSREHAPWALEANGIHMVIARGFARIFRQNMFNCGMLAVSLVDEDLDRLFDLCAGNGAEIEADVEALVLRARAGDREVEIPFAVSDFDQALVRAGGWVEYADENY
ncbi:MAG: 3-isopropylmalate dehydratase small subunit [Desulfobacterales bacterium]|nr:3-isopropylmalate dehydratase small subunit [Desulfobacterales bacterium]